VRTGVEARVNCFNSVSLVLLGFVAFSPGAVEADDHGPLPSGSNCARELTHRVQAWADALSGFEADFEQVSHPVAFGGGPPPPPTTSKGRVFLARPGRMRWNYEEPVASQVVSDGRDLWIYDPASKEVQHLEATRGFLDAAALEFLMGEGRLAETFEVLAPRCEGDEVEIELVPRADAGYERLGLRVRPGTGEVVATTLVDLLGNRTQVRFEQAQSDRVPAASHFRFEVPDGVEVIKMRSSPTSSTNPSPGS